LYEDVNPEPPVAQRWVSQVAPLRDGEILGRSLGGHDTKAGVIADGAGWGFAGRGVPRHAQEPSHAIPYSTACSGDAGLILANRGRASDRSRLTAWRSFIRSMMQLLRALPAA
jgi:hypothetical protein